MTHDAHPSRGHRLLHRGKALLRSTRTMLWYGARKFARDRTTLLAAALAYRTVFSLIPMLVLAIIAVRSFADPTALRERVFEYFKLNELTISLPAATPGEPEQTYELSSLVDTFTERATERLTKISFGGITIVGVAVLIYAALSLLIQIEQAFNAVYGATAGRRLMVRLTNYWSLLTLGSLMLVISFAVSEYLADWMRTIGGPVITGVLMQFLTTVGVTWLVLIFAYTRMPTTRVKLRAAAAGAGVSAILWEIAKQGLTWFVGHATTGQISIYGPIALIPLFLLWVQITWMIVLVGLQITYAIQNFNNAALLKAEDRRRQRDPIIDPSIGVILMRDIARAFREGKPRHLSGLADNAGITEVLALPILDRLAQTGFVNRVEKGDDDAFVLARPEEEIKVPELLLALRELIPSPRDADEARLLEQLLDKQVRSTQGLSLANVNNDALLQAAAT